MARSIIGRLLGVLFCGLAVGAGCRSQPDPAPEVPRGTAPGDRAPALEGVLAGGEGFALDSRSDSATVIVFYRSASCGLCRVQLEQLQQHLAAYRRQGARVVGVTLDEPEVSRRLAAEMAIGFALLSVGVEAFERWEVLQPEAAFPLPAAYVVDAGGLIRFRQVGRNAADRTSDAGLLTVLETLGRGR